MKILVINGSPKCENSNTLILTKAFCEGVKDVTYAEVDLLNIYKMKISDCIGCFNCWKKTPGICGLKDDMCTILSKIMCYDIIIWSFPLYFFGLPSRVKAVMDRQLPLYLPYMQKDAEYGGHPNRYDFSNKKFVAISTCGFYTYEGNYTAINEQLTRLYGSDGFYSIFCGQGELLRVAELENRTVEYIDCVQNAGRQFARGELSKNVSQELQKLLFNRKDYEQMADSSWNE